MQWVKNGYPSLITDSASLELVGGSSKIDSLQNMLLLQSDLHNSWDNHYIAVNRSVCIFSSVGIYVTSSGTEFLQRGYIVIPFLPAYDDVAGKVLKLDHILDADLRPLDKLFCDHFLQAVLKNMKGVRESYWDHEVALGDGRMDLSRDDIWDSELGKAHLEFEMAHRLHSLRVAQEEHGC
jgi:HNH endonuclease